MSDQQLLEKVIQHIGEYTEKDVSHLNGQTPLLGAFPGQDSLTLMEMLMYLEDCFEVEFEDKVMETVETLDGLVAYIRDLRQGAGVGTNLAGAH